MIALLKDSRDIKTQTIWDLVCRVSAMKAELEACKRFNAKEIEEPFFSTTPETDTVNARESASLGVSEMKLYS